MGWHYRAHKTYDVMTKEAEWGVVEYFPDLKAWTEHKIYPESDTFIGLVECLERMLKDIKKYRPIVERKKDGKE